jgi:nucleoside-diphosphate kinase
MEQTLLVLKPDAVMRRGVGAAVLDQIAEVLSDVSFWGFLEIPVSKTLAEEHYAIHQGKFFYPWLLQFIQVGNVIATVLEGEDIVERLRGVLGATFVEKADAESLRGKYGLVGGVNVAHASDEPANAEKEVALWQNQAGLEVDIEAKDDINAYISRWQETPVVSTNMIRNYCQEYAQIYTNRYQYLNLIAEALRDECPNWSEFDIHKLADAILGNMDLDNTKKT